jgi:peptide/nickel transport system substrate-binding protein
MTMQHSRVTTLRRLGVLGAVAASVVGLAACGSSGSGSSATSTKSSAPVTNVITTGCSLAGSGVSPTGHTLNLSFFMDPGQPPDPDIFYAGQGLILTTNTYEGLLQYKPGTATPTLEPSLATSWTVSANKEVYNFQLRHGVTFHDGTPFTSAAIEASFARRAAVGQGPAYMVADVASVKTHGDYAATITLKTPNSAFLTYLASAYGPKMMSPTALAAHKGSDNDEKYLTNHDIGTGPYMLTKAQVNIGYELKAYPGYWGPKPYFTTVELPVLDSSSTVQADFKTGQLAAILHDIPSSAVKSYLADKSVDSCTQPSMISEYFYVSPHKGMLTSAANRLALLKAINVNALTQGAYYGRGSTATQLYPANMMPAQYAKQDYPYDPSALKTVVASLPAGEKSLTVGYDSSQPDSQIVATLISSQLDADGLQVTVKGYPTSEIFGWPSDPKTAPDLLATPGWPDAPSPYTWGHISFDPGAGLNYTGCTDKATTAELAKALVSGTDADFSTAATDAEATGCWENLVNVTDFQVAQPWLKGMADAHVVSNPNTLMLANLSAG